MHCQYTHQLCLPQPPLSGFAGGHETKKWPWRPGPLSMSVRSRRRCTPLGGHRCRLRHGRWFPVRWLRPSGVHRGRAGRSADRDEIRRRSRAGHPGRDGGRSRVRDPAALDPRGAGPDGPSQVRPTSGPDRTHWHAHHPRPRGRWHLLLPDSQILAVFYDDLGQTVPAPGLIHLGAVDGDLSPVAAGNRVRVRIDLADSASF